MKKVLFVAGRMVYGGLEMMLINFFRNIDKEKVSIDFMLHYEDAGTFDDEIKRAGSKIYIMPRLKPKNLFKYVRSLVSFFREHRGEYDVVHGHITSSGIIYLTIARIFGVKTRVIHAHYADVQGNHYAFLERLMLMPLRFCATHYFACSDKAAAFCFGTSILKYKNYRLIKNGVDVKKFSYSAEVREAVRRELGVDGKYVVMHVGRFESEKNHKLILDIASNTEDDNTVFVFVGSGSLEDDIRGLAMKLGLSDKVIFLGARPDVNRVLQAADVFILPSLFEGLPVVGIEAQCAGLPCLFSDEVTREVDVTGNCRFIPIDNPILWISEINSMKSFKRENTDNKISESGYDIAAQAKALEKFYLTADGK